MKDRITLLRVIVCGKSAHSVILSFIFHFSSVMLFLAACSPSGDEMRRQLAELERMNSADSLMTNDSLAESLAKYFDRHGTPNERMRAHYILGRTYADLGEAPAAINAYQDAAACADTTAKDCDYAKLSRVHAQMAEVYYAQLLPDNMIREERRAVRYAKMAEDTMQFIACYAMLAEGYEMKEMPDSALSILTEAFLLYENANASDLAAALCCSIADLYRQKKDYQKAAEYMQIYECCSGLFDDQGNILPGKEIYYSCKGHLCLDTSDEVNAEYYFRKLLGFTTNTTIKIAALASLRQFFSVFYDRDSLIKYNNLCDSLGDIAHMDVEIQKTLQVQAMYDHARSERIANQKSIEAARLLYVLVISVSLLVIIILLSAIVYISHRNARKLLESKYRSEMEQLAQAQANLLALRSEQSVSERLIIQNEQEIKALQENVEQFRQKIHTLQRYALNERLQKASVTVRLREYLKHEPYQIPGFEDWRELKILINHEIPSFYDILNVEGNGLNDFEYDVCILTRVQFSPGNIAKFKKCTPAYITQVRKTIFNKLFKKEGRAEDLDEYLMSLS